MNILIIPLLFCAVYGLSFIKKRKQIFDFDATFSNCLKGVAAMLVVFAHCEGKLGLNNIQFLGGVGVSIFLFSSGYGLEKSFQKKGLNNFWKNKIFKVILPFVLISLIGNIFLTRIGLQNSLKISFLMIPISSFEWYIQFILICYIIFYISKIEKIGKKDDVILIFLFFALFFVFDTMFFAIDTEPFLRARQMFCFPFGVLVARYKLNFSLKKQIICLVVCLFLGVLFMLITNLPKIKLMPLLLQNTMSLLTCMPLAFSVILFCKLFKPLLNNFFLEQCGKMSFEIYLVHGYSLCFLQNNWFSIIIYILLVTLITTFLYFGKRLLMRFLISNK